MMKQTHIDDKKRVGLVTKVTDPTNKELKSLFENKHHIYTIKDMLYECCKKTNRIYHHNYNYCFNGFEDIYNKLVAGVEIKDLKIYIYQLKREEKIIIDIIINNDYTLSFTWGDNIKDNNCYYDYKVKSSIQIEHLTSKQKRMCTDKHQYQTYSSATKACAILGMRRYSYARIYQCPYCNKYHITTKHNLNLN